MFHYHVPQL